ncbi:MAG: hypothetical protein WHT08_09760 [Bryobacteraceae bacterium]
MKRARWILLLALLQAGCARLPAPVPPPARRGALNDHPAHYAFLRERAADARIVEGVDREIHDDWRWAGRRAVLRFAVDETQGIQFRVVIIVPHEFVQAGGRRIEVRIGGNPLGGIDASRAGYIDWKQPVPEEWLAPGKEIRAELVADAEWMQGNERRGYILGSAGFTL